MSESLRALLDEIASPGPLPGAGFVCALAVGMAAGLVTMAARLSKEWPDARGMAAQAEALRRRVTPLAERNAQAYFEAVTALGRLGGTNPGGGDDQLAKALARSAVIPLEIARGAADVATLAAEVAESGDPSLRPDAAVAAALCFAGARGAAALVEVNLATAPGDERLARAKVHVEEAADSLERALDAVG